MTDYSNKVAMVCDLGLFVDVATRLSHDFGNVYYYSPWQSPFPKSNHRIIGEGIPGVTRVNNFWEVLDEVDLFVFPDVSNGDLQVHLRSLGKRVWGSGLGEELELYRPTSKKYLSSLGLDVGSYKVLIGLDKLRDYLKANKNQWVKVSITRGDMESFKSIDYDNIEPKLDELEYKLGAKKYTCEFTVEASIDNAVEIGYDGYSVDGQFPSQACIGIEIKDKGYIGHVIPKEKQPQQITMMNTLISDTLRNYQYRNFFAMEARITKDGTPWIIDPCCRQGSPPSEMLQVMYENYSDILWHGAEGELVSPVCSKEWGAELLLHSSWADANWASIDFPMELRPYITFRNLSVIKGKYYVVPQVVGLPEIGAVCAVESTLEKAIAVCRERAEQVKGYMVEVYAEALDEASAELEKLKGFGIELG